MWYQKLVGEVLLELRYVNGLTQEDLARTLGITKETWSRVEAGLVVLRVDRLRLAALALDTRPSKILEEVDRRIAARSET